MLLPNAFQDKEVMALGAKVVKPEPVKADPVAAFEKGEHLKSGQVVPAAYSCELVGKGVICSGLPHSFDYLPKFQASDVVENDNLSIGQLSLMADICERLAATNEMLADASWLDLNKSGAASDSGSPDLADDLVAYKPITYKPITAMEVTAHNERLQAVTQEIATKPLWGIPVKRSALSPLIPSESLEAYFSILNGWQDLLPSARLAGPDTYMAPAGPREKK